MKELRLENVVAEGKPGRLFEEGGEKQDDFKNKFTKKTQ